MFQRANLAATAPNANCATSLWHRTRVVLWYYTYDSKGLLLFCIRHRYWYRQRLIP